ncbi:hypothetical protein DRF65_22990 [Chryseobacterium pennae]|uniref:Uncharacterized protein n=2 Tax=Chryseobacterium group TaxID=2782232 RepID=A0A3D9C2W0_9FLAO|nr:hypothetical protein DRF65_22990 [Chryseobacterium pennae]
MMNSNFYKLIMILFMVSCVSEPIVYQQVDYKGDIFYGDIRQKKTGKFIFPNMNFSYSLYKGELNGKILLIEKSDTIVFGHFKRNQPIGKYINRIDQCYQCKYIFRKTVIEKIDGEGEFNKQSKKDGYWKEKSQEGNYSNGKKNGVWKIYKYNDLENSQNTIKEVIYKNDSLINHK